MPELTEQHIQQLYESPEPISALVEWGHTETEAYDLLWELPFRENAPPASEPMVTFFRKTYKEQPIEDKALVVERVFRTTGFWDFSQHEQLRLLSHFCKHPAEQVLSYLELVPASHVPLVFLYLLKWKQLKEIPEEHVTALCDHWLCFDHWTAQAIQKIGVKQAALEKAFGVERWRQGCVAQLKEQALIYKERWDGTYLDKEPLPSLVAIGAKQPVDLDGLTENIVAYGVEALPLVEEALLPILMSFDRGGRGSLYADGWAGAALVPAYKDLLRRSEQPLPEILLSLVRSLFWRDQEKELLDWFALLGDEQAGELFIEIFPYSTFAQRHFHRIEAEGFLEKLIDLFCKVEPTHFNKHALRHGINQCPERLLPLLEEALYQEKLPAKHCVFLAELIAMIPTDEGTQALGRMLQHNSKRLRSLAAETLMRRGDEALEVTQEALLARKKAIRQTGLSLFLSLHHTPARAAAAATVLAQSSDETLKEALLPLSC